MQEVVVGVDDFISLKNDNRFMRVVKYMLKLLSFSYGFVQLNGIVLKRIKVYHN